MKIPIKIVEEMIEEIAGKEAIQVYKILKGKANVNEFNIAEGEKRIVTVAGQQGSLVRNNLGQNVVSLPDQTVVVTNYGNPVGYTTTGAQQLINLLPNRYSDSAGFYSQPVNNYFVPSPPTVFQPSYETFSSGFIFLGSSGFGGGSLVR